MADPAISAQLNQPFKEQVAFFRQKLGNLVPTERWTERQKEAHDKGFMVAGATGADLLAEMAAAVDKAISQGTSLQEFRNDFSGIVQRNGWDYKGDFNWRTRVIYTTNLRTSYAAGRLAQLQEADYGHWKYRHSPTVSHPRREHLAWDGLVLAADDAWWRTHYPPNGWGCQCRVFGVRNPENVSQPPKDTIDPNTGEPTGIDKGWGYMPGATVSDAVRIISDKLPRLPAPIGSALSKLWTERDYEKMTEGFGQFVDVVDTERIARGKSFVVGAIQPEWLSALKEKDVMPETAEIIVRDTDLLHTFRDTKVQPLPLSWYKQMPQHLRSPQAVILDESHKEGPALLMVFDIQGERGKKVVLQLDYHVKKLGKANTLGTGRELELEGLRRQPGYTLLVGQI